MLYCDKQCFLELLTWGEPHTLKSNCTSNCTLNPTVHLNCVENCSTESVVQSVDFEHLLFLLVGST